MLSLSCQFVHRTQHDVEANSNEHSDDGPNESLWMRRTCPPSVNLNVVKRDDTGSEILLLGHCFLGAALEAPKRNLAATEWWWTRIAWCFFLEAF